MPQQPENKTFSLESILKILRFQAESMPLSTTSSRYLQALASFQSSVFSLQSSDSGQAAGNDGTAVFYRRPESDGNLCEDSVIKTEDSRLKTALTDWQVSLWLTGTPFSTASLYLDIISSLWGSAAKQGQLPKTDLFKELKAQLKSLGQRGWQGGIDEEIFARALRLTKNAACLISDDAIAADLVLWSLTHNLMPLSDIALLRPASHAESAESRERKVKIDNCGLSPLRPLRETAEEKAIIARQCKSARRKYIFPLHQSQRTEAQLRKHISKIVNALFKRARLPQATDPYQTVEALWAYAALSIGIPASRLVAWLGHAPLGLPVLKLSSFSSLSSSSQRIVENIDNVDYADNKKYFSQNIGKVFLENPPRWYALSLRPGVRFTQLCRRLELLSNTSSSNVQRQTYNVPLFYPCEEIARAIGKKIVIKERPFIRSVVFFQAKLTDIGRLFARIGDLAWCYRQSARPGAPYAEISERQFRLFQQTIARFTPDYEVAPTGEFKLKPNDRVEILGGLFAGHEANFVKSEESRVFGQESRVKSEESSTVYRLNIIGDNGFEWRISVDSRLTK